MIITNSLGSNYQLDDRWLALRLLFQPWKWKNGKEIEELERVIPAQAGIPTGSWVNPGMTGVSVHLYAKGRQAIEEALRQLHIGTGDEVIVQALTCVAVVDPIVAVGARPVYSDISPLSTNPLLADIKKVLTKKTKAIILQHTLGFINPENDAIELWAKKNNVAVIQDLAHAMGIGKLPFTISRLPFTILSFSQDKVVDGVAGGALISNQRPRKNTNVLKHQSSIETARQLLYPLATWAIRATYSFGVGKVIHRIANIIGLLRSPIEPPIGADMPNAMAALTLHQWKKLPHVAAHRKKIALLYDALLNEKLKIVNKKQIIGASNLRYPIAVQNRSELETILQKHHFYLMDHWYDAPLAPEWIDYEKYGYTRGSCVNAERMARVMFNLPTHINVSVEIAKKLATLVNKYGKY